MTKPLERLWVFDSNRDISENWSQCAPLHYAWFELAPFAKKEEYRDSGAKSPIVAASLALEMQMWLKNRISNGEFIVLGFRTAPNPELIPSKIPHIYLSASGISIDWNSDKLIGVGHSFEDVRICRLNGKVTQIIEPSVMANSQLKRGGGRPSEYPKTKLILDTLFRDERNKTASAERLICRVNELRKLANAADPPIHDRTLRTHLKRYRKELAETGNN